MNLVPTPHAFHGRILLIKILVISGFLTVLGGYYRIQILEREHYEALGEKYRIKKRRIKATRGLIYDRNERLITQNMPTYNLVLLRDEMEESWSRFKPRIATFLDLTEEELDQRYKKRSHLLSQPVLLAENINFSESMRIRRNRLRFPGLAIETTERRYYSYGTLFTHVLGYVGEVSREKLHQFKGLQMGDIVGKGGIELAYNEMLTGADGERTIMIDNRGVYRQSTVSNPPTPGDDVYLTIDFELQKLAYDVLDGRGGSIVLMDVPTGEILVYVSSPTFDLNLFTKRISQKQWDALLNTPGKPFVNRPIQGTYAPGSVFKIVSAIAALKGHKITPSTTYFCGGSFDYYNHTFHCHKRAGHGLIDLEAAIQGSCNVFFYQIAKDLDIDELAEMATSFGFGAATKFDLHGEKVGLVPTRAWKKERYKQVWFPGETLSVAIGQGSLQTTPMQLLGLMAAIGSDGKVPRPHLLLKSGKNQNFKPGELTARTIPGIKAEHYRLMRRAMWKAVNQSEGSGARARVEDFDVCGKTGSAQLVTFTNEADRKEDALVNAWFAGFAPRDKTEVAIVVLVEQAGHGGSNAAPIAKIMLEAYKKRKAEMDPT